MNSVIGGFLELYMGKDHSGPELPDAALQKDALRIVRDPEFKKSLARVRSGQQEQVGEDEGRSAMDHIISHVNHARGIFNHGHFSDDDEMEFQDHYKQIDDLINTKAPNSDILAKMRQLVPGVDDSEDEIRANLIKMIEIGKTAESVSKVGGEELNRIKELSGVSTDIR